LLRLLLLLLLLPFSLALEEKVAYKRPHIYFSDIKDQECFRLQI
jgi:hypothetical protein